MNYGSGGIEGAVSEGKTWTQIEKEDAGEEVTYFSAREFHRKFFLLWDIKTQLHEAKGMGSLSCPRRLSPIQRESLYSF